MTDTLANDAPRPMTEAPRDGTKVLAWWPCEPETAGWVTTWAWGEFSGKGWQNPWAWAYDDDDVAPTHFLPHPGEPK